MHCGGARRCRRSVARRRGDRQRRPPHPARRPAVLGVAHVWPRGALRLQPHHARRCSSSISAKGLALAVVLGGPLLVAMLFLMERAGRSWWLWAFALWLAVMFLMAWAWPAFIAPLFNRFSPLEDEALKARIEALLARCGFASKGVFVVDNSRRSSHGNAYFTGIGRHKRIVFFDTLLERLGAPGSRGGAGARARALSPAARAQAPAAVGRRGLRRAGVARLARGAARLLRALGVPRPSTYAALLLFVLAVPAFTFFLTPAGVASGRAAMSSRRTPSPRATRAPRSSRPRW